MQRQIQYLQKKGVNLTEILSRGYATVYYNAVERSRRQNSYWQ
jgi:hypothetical protein